MPGPAPGATCSVCNHAAIVLINRAINEGMSDRKIAGQFGFKYHGAILRHRRARHPGVKLPEDEKPQAPVIPPPDGDDPRAVLAWLVQTLHSQAQDGDIRGDIARELRLSLETQAKLGNNEPPPVVQVRDVEGLAQMLSEMHEALKPWPEAREAMAAVWRRHRAPWRVQEDQDADPEE